MRGIGSIRSFRELLLQRHRRPGARSKKNSRSTHHLHGRRKRKRVRTKNLSAMTGLRNSNRGWAATQGTLHIYPGCFFLGARRAF
jgi:hypothetical protein